MNSKSETSRSSGVRTWRSFERRAAGQQSYVLLVVKPSGIAQYWSIRAAIDALPESSRPAIGLDLIPEDAFVSELFPSALIGGAS